MVSASTKYIVVSIIGLGITGLTYLSNHPTLSEASLIGLGLVLLTAALHDLETPASTTPATTKN